MFWFFAVILLLACAAATFVTSLRSAILALWVAGLAAGAIYLTLGAELLALVQWVASTLIAISFVFFSIMFGEYAPRDPKAAGKRPLPIYLCLSVGLAFAAVVWLGMEKVSEIDLNMPVEGNDLLALGRALVDRNLLALEILGLTLFLVLVGGGVIARPDSGERIK